MCPVCETIHSEEMIKICGECFSKLEAERLIQIH